MIFGICAGPELAQDAKNAGFTFLEGGVGGVLKPTCSEAEFEDSFAKLSEAVLPTTNLNCLLPGGMFIAGPQADIPQAVAYCTTAIQRAGRSGIETICFGSGNARKCPEGWSFPEAERQIREFLKALAPVAKESGVVITIEDLNKTETNTLCTVAETAAMARSVASPAICILIDGYHWAKDADSAADIVASASLIKHTHIATTLSRFAPGEEPCDFAPFALALSKAGYKGKMSVEAKINDKSPEGLSKIIKTLKASFNS